MDRITAYTTHRPDVCLLVPNRARFILDLGCSDGSLGEALKSAQAEREVCGVEFSEDLANRASVKLNQVIVADLNDASCLNVFSHRKFDCIIAADILEHLLNPINLLKQLHPLLADDAVLIVSLPNIRHHSAFYSIFVQGTFPRRNRGLFDDTHLHWFTLRDSRNLLQSAGYALDHVHSTLRVGDKGGGRLNKLVSRLLNPISGFTPIREFMTYQYVLRARPVPQARA